MEQKVGPTDGWEYRIEHEIKEKLIKAAFSPTIDAEVPRVLEVSIKKQWIEWAATHGDTSYLKYTQGKIIRSPVWYDGSIHSEKDLDPVESFDMEKKGEEEDARNSRHECDKCERSCEGCNNNGGKGKLVLV